MIALQKSKISLSQSHKSVTVLMTTGGSQPFSELAPIGQQVFVETGWFTKTCSHRSASICHFANSETSLTYLSSSTLVAGKGRQGYRLIFEIQVAYIKMGLSQ